MNTNTIEYVTIASTGNATDFGDLTVTREKVASSSSSTRGLWFGGSTGAYVNVIDYVTINTTGNATDFGDLSQNAALGASSSSSTRAVNALGESAGVGTLNIIEYVTIATTGNSTDFGDLTVARGYSGACSNGHGGL